MTQFNQVGQLHQHSWLQQAHLISLQLNSLALTTVLLLNFTSKISFSTSEDLLVSMLKNKFLSKPTRLIRTHGEYGFHVITFPVHWGSARNFLCLFIVLSSLKILTIHLKPGGLSSCGFYLSPCHISSISSLACVWTLPWKTSDFWNPLYKGKGHLKYRATFCNPKIPFLYRRNSTHPSPWLQCSLLPTALLYQHHQKSRNFPFSLKILFSTFPKALFSTSQDFRQPNPFLRTKVLLC